MNMKFLARGGKIKKGETAIVGEAGRPEAVRVDQSGQANVTPVPNIPTTKDVKRETRNWNMKFGDQLVAKGTDYRDIYPTSPDAYLKSLGTDYQQRADQLNRIRENEQNALNIMRGSVDETQAASDQMMARGGQAASGIDQATAAAGMDLNAGIGAANEMVGGVNAAGNRAIENVQGATDEALAWAKESGAADIADTERRAEAQSRLGQKLYDQGMEEIRKDTAEGLAKYTDMTAQMVSRKSGAVNQFYDQKSAEIAALASQGASPEAIEAQKARNEMSRFSEMEELGNQVGIEYNNTMASMRMQYTTEKMNTLRSLSTLVGDMAEKGNQLVAQVRMGVGERIGNIQQLGIQAATSANEAALQAKSWALQRAGEIKARVSEGQAQLKITGQQMKLADAQMRENLKLSYDSAKRAGLSDLADATWKQTESFVPLSPLMATVLNFWTQKELMGKSEYTNMIIQAGAAEEAERARPRGSRSGMGSSVATRSTRNRQQGSAAAPATAASSPTKTASSGNQTGQGTLRSIDARTWQ